MKMDKRLRLLTFYQETPLGAPPLARVMLAARVALAMFRHPLATPRSDLDVSFTRIIFLHKLEAVSLVHDGPRRHWL